MSLGVLFSLPEKLETREVEECETFREVEHLLVGDFMAHIDNCFFFFLKDVDGVF